MIRFVTIEQDGSLAPRSNALLMSFGITEAIAAVVGSLATSAGVGAATAATIGSIAAPSLVGAGLGAGTSALFGGNIGQGALLGGLGGALGPSLNALGITTGTAGSGALGALSPAASQAAQNIESGNTGAGAGSGAGALDAEGNPISSYATGAAGLNPAAGQAANTAAGAAGGIKTPTGTGGAIGGLGLANMVGLIAAMSAQANRPATTQAATPAGFSQPWNPNPSGTLARTSNPFTPTTGSYYTYGQQAEPQFFNNNALNFKVPGTAPGMAKGGALQHAMRHGRYAIGGHFSSGGGDHYVEGDGGGQDDNIDAKLSPGEWVADSNFVSAIGDGNNEEGSRRLYAMRRAVMDDKGMKHVVPPKLKKSPLSYLKEAA